MKSQLYGHAVLEAAARAGKLDANQLQAFRNNKLTTKAEEYFHRTLLSNVGTANGIPVFNENVDPSFGLTNLQRGCKLPDDVVITHIAINVAVVGNNYANAAAITPEVIKGASFDNIVLNLGLTTVKIPDAIKNSNLRFVVKDQTASIIPVKKMLVLGNSKQYSEAEGRDNLELPDGIQVLKAGDTLKPLLLMPEGVPLSTPDFGSGSKQYLFEVKYIGYKIITVA